MDRSQFYSLPPFLISNFEMTKLLSPAPPPPPYFDLLRSLRLRSYAVNHWQSSVSTCFWRHHYIAIGISHTSDLLFIYVILLSVIILYLNNISTCKYELAECQNSHYTFSPSLEFETTKRTYDRVRGHIVKCNVIYSYLYIYIQAQIILLYVLSTWLKSRTKYMFFFYTRARKSGDDNDDNCTRPMGMWQERGRYKTYVYVRYTR